MPYCIGKPNPLFLQLALQQIDGHVESSLLIGDQMETDMVAGIEAGMPTVLVLTGSAPSQGVTRLAYQPTRILPSIAAALVDLTLS
jgi:NagD protein